MRDLIREAHAYYARHYGPTGLDDIRDALRRLVKGREYMTLAEVRSLEEAGLATGYSIPNGGQGPKPTPLGECVLARIEKDAATNHAERVAEIVRRQRD